MTALALAFGFLFLALGVMFEDKYVAGATSHPGRSKTSAPVAPRSAIIPLTMSGPHRQPRTRSAAEKELESLYRQLREVARDLFIQKPHARDMVRSVPALDLELRLEFSGRDGEDARQARALLSQLDEHLDDAILAGAAFRPGRVYCFFCESADCAHAAPAEPRDVFYAYSETGTPLFKPLLDVVLEVAPDMVDRLVADRSEPVRLAFRREDLIRDRLEAFAEQDRVYDLRGQVVLGYYRRHGEEVVRTTSGHAPGEKFGVTLQVVRSATRSGVVRLGVNTIGILPDGRDVIVAVSPDHRWPVSEMLYVTNRRLARLNTELKQMPRRQRLGVAAEMADHLLLAMIDKANRHEKQAGWRTDHAARRADERGRPTNMVRKDLEGVRHDRVLYDTHKETWIILGGRGRAHVFSPDGLHVTSLHLEKKEIESRRSRQRWRQGERDEIKTLLTKVKDVFAADRA